MNKIELIDRAELMEKLRIVFPCSSCWEKKEPCIGLCYSVKMAVMLTPTIDAAPVRRSEWVTDDDNTDDWAEPYCKKCSCFIPRGPANFCPNCGADMRTEEHHDSED